MHDSYTTDQEQEAATMMPFTPQFSSRYFLTKAPPSSTCSVMIMVPAAATEQEGTIMNTSTPRAVANVANFIVQQSNRRGNGKLYVKISDKEWEKENHRSRWRRKCQKFNISDGKWRAGSFQRTEADLLILGYI